MNKKLIRAAAAILSAAQIMLLLCGCYDNNEIDSLAQVVALGVEPCGDENIRFTFAVADIGEFSSESDSGAKKSMRSFTAESTDIENAVMSVNSHISKQLNFAHMCIVVASRMAACEYLGDIAEYLEYIAKQESFKLSHEAAELIARLADGGVRDALSLLDQCSASETIDLEVVYNAMGLAGNRRTAQLMGGILDHDTDKTLRDFNSMWMDGKDPATLLTELSGLLRDTLMTHVAPKGARSLISGGYDDTTLGELSGRMTTEEIICAMETVQKYTASMRESTSPKTTAELCLVSLCDNTMGESIAELRARISRLELQLSSGSFTPVREDTRPAPVHAEEEPERYEPEPPRRREEAYIPEEDDLDPEMFAEEQPEDSFVQRTGQTQPAPEPEAQPKADAPAGEPTWKDICAKAAGVLPMDIKLRLDDSASVRGKIENGTLRIEVVPGFLYGRFNRQDVLAKFSEAATALAGREIHALLSELHDEPRPQRSLDELKQFKEVKFI